MVILRSKSKSKPIFVFCLWVAFKAFAEPLPLQYGQRVMQVALNSGQSGVQKQLFRMSVGSLFTNCKTAAVSKHSSGFSLGQGDTSGEMEHALYLLPARPGEESDGCDSESSPAPSLSWLPEDDSGNDFPALACRFDNDLTDKEAASVCRLAPLSVVFEGYKSISGRKDQSVPVGGEIAKLQGNHGIDENCRFLLMLSRQFVFTRQLWLEKGDELAAIKCPSVNQEFSSVSVVAIDLTKVGHCHIQTGVVISLDAEGFNGVSVDTAIVQCPLFGQGEQASDPGQSPSIAGNNVSASGPQDGDSSTGRGGERGASAGGDGGGDDGRKGGGSKKKYQTADDLFMDANELFVAFLKYLMSSDSGVERQQGEYLLSRFRNMLGQSRSGLKVEVRSILDAMSSVAPSVHSMLTLKSAFSELSLAARKELFVRAAGYERHIRVSAHPDRKNWDKIYSKQNDGEGVNNPGVSNFVNKKLNPPPVAAKPKKI